MHIILKCIFILLLSVSTNAKPPREQRDKLEKHFGGKILHEYGKVKSIFGTPEVKNHICLQVEPGAPIKALVAGKARRVGWFSEYQGLAVETELNSGETIIYGCLSKISIVAGDQVAPGQEVGFATTVSHRCGGSFGVSIYYFRNGKSKNPYEISF